MAGLQFTTCRVAYLGAADNISGSVSKWRWTEMDVTLGLAS